MRAVIVGTHDLGESDRVVRLLGPERGRVDAVARGARRSRKRFGGALDPGTRVELTLSARGRLPSITQLDVEALA